MKIGILLPYKENFSPDYPGAVSLFVYETSINSKFRKNIIVFGNTNLKKKFNLKYKNIELFKVLSKVKLNLILINLLIFKINIIFQL